MEKKNIELDELTRLRALSQQISRDLRGRLDMHLGTLASLFAPRQILGEYMESAYDTRILGAEKNVTQIEAAFKEILDSNFGIKASITTPIPNIENKLVIQPWEYLHPLGEEQLRSVVMSSPVRWLISYPGSLNLSDCIKLQQSGRRPDGDTIKQILLRALTLRTVVENTNDLADLLADLRFEVSIEQNTTMPGVPFVVLSAPVPSFRPPDSVVEKVIALSGKSVFEELIDIDELSTIEDPLRSRIAGFLR